MRCGDFLAGVADKHLLRWQGNNGVGFGEPTALGSFSRDSQVRASPPYYRKQSEEHRQESVSAGMRGAKRAWRVKRGDGKSGAAGNTERHGQEGEFFALSDHFLFSTCLPAIVCVAVCGVVPQVQGHSSLGAWPGLSASNWGGAPYYSNLGARTSYAIPNQTGNGGAYP